MFFLLLLVRGIRSARPPSLLSSLTNNNWRRLFDKFEEGVVNHSIGGAAAAADTPDGNRLGTCNIPTIGVEGWQ